MKTAWSLTVPLSLVILAVTGWSACCVSAEPAISDQDLAFFESKIRPVFVEHCYSCHNSGESAEGGLVLDHREGLQRGGDSGPVVVPGNPAASRLLPILRHEVAGLEMPEGGPKLDRSVLHDVERWIQMGAPDPRDQPPSSAQLAAESSWPETLRRRKQWWSLLPIQSSSLPPPGVSGSHPIDRFIDARLAEQGLQPSPPAETTTLIRRLYVALTGLPPDAKQVAEWTSRINQSPNRKHVLEQLIDDLLDSPHFGERFARHWMDWIRYAESHGSEGDPEIDNAWMYRDYLIRALNADVSYDQLVREHVAGDLLNQPRLNEALGLNESSIGTAHLRMVFHGFAPTDALDEKVRFIDDQINVLSKAFLGLTVSCARCHDHKFDAISQSDYYAWFGIMASCRPGRNVVDTPEIQNRNRDDLAALKERIRQQLIKIWGGSVGAAAKKLIDLDAKPKTELGSLLNRFRTETDDTNSFTGSWMKLIETEQRRLDEFNRFTRSTDRLGWNLADASDAHDWYGHGIGVQHHAAAGTFAMSNDDAILVEGIYPAGVYTHELSTKHPGRFSSPDFDLSNQKSIWVQAIGGGEATLRYVVQDYPRKGTVYPVKTLNDRWSLQSFDVSYWSGDSIHVELATALDAPVLTKDNPRSWFGLRRVFVTDENVTRVPEAVEALVPIIEAAGDDPPANVSELQTLLASVLRGSLDAWEASALSDEQALFLDACLREGVLPNRKDMIAKMETAELNDLVEKYRRLEEAIRTPRRAPGLEETAGRDQELMVRGNHKRLGDPVPRRFLEAIDSQPYQTESSGRLQLADDLLRDDNPLTRRVIVNRIWHHLFGRGIVATPDNFGRLGATPSHPELLDWLAEDFAKQEWSIKKLVRRIVTSAAWQRSSVPMKGVATNDPENIYFAHANVRRLEAEAIRDALLFVSQRLDTQLYGPPVASAAPRRSIYVNVVRNRLDPFLRAFDFPEPFSATGRRDATNVPAQSLALMNDTQIADFAESLATSLIHEAPREDPGERIEKLFLKAFSRRPSPREIDLAKDYVGDAFESAESRRQQRSRLADHTADLQRRIQTLLDLARSGLEKQQSEASRTEQSQLAQPIAAWDFTSGTEDRIGNVDVTLHGDARLNPAGLTVRDGGYALSEPLNQTLAEKTLEVWLQLDNLTQRGGGALSLQSKNGNVFDAIVFAERDPAEWLAGSNYFERTERFGGKKESEAKLRVHVAITYANDGTVSCYRNGEPYGTAYQSNGPQAFPAGESIVGFGVRHLPATGNRTLSGTIIAAQVYSKCLSAGEVAASFRDRVGALHEAEWLKLLTAEQRREVEELRREQSEAVAQLNALPTSGFTDQQQAWTELARAIFLFKEFIYVR